MHRSLSQSFNTLLLAGATALGARLFTPEAVADSYSSYEPGFLHQAERALRRNDPAHALGILEANSERDLKNRHRAEAEGLNCRAHLAMGDAIEAREACQAAIDLDKSRSSWRYFNNLGAAELTLGNLDAAETAFSRAAMISAWVATPRRNLALVSRIREAKAVADGEQLAAEIR